MKIFISNDNKTLEGFVNISTKNMARELTNIPQHSCSLIIANDVLDAFEYESYKEIISALYDKLRITGKMSLSGTDPNILSRFIINSQIDTKQFSSIVTNANSMHTLTEVKAFLINYADLEITTKINGVKYELSATRS